MKVKGFAFVLNNSAFPNHPIAKLRKRNGSEFDFANMIHLFVQLGYEVEKKEDLTGKVSLQTLKFMRFLITKPKDTTPTERIK